MHLVGYLYEDYHDARSLEHKVNFHFFFAYFDVMSGIPNFLHGLTHPYIKSGGQPLY
jgi:hypothetical protein